MKFGKIISAVLLAATVAAAAMLPVSAATAGTVGFGAEAIKTAPKMDGTIGATEYGSGDWISLTDSRLSPKAWVSGHAIDPDLKVEYKFAWDKTNLYIAVKVAGDKSASQKGTADAAWFGKADCVQVFLNPEYIVKDASPVCLTVGFTENGMPVVWRSKLGTGVIITDKCKGYSTAWKDNGYTMELSVPWKEICIDTDKIKTSTAKIADGTKIGISLVYADVGGTASYVKTDAAAWNGADFCTGYITLNPAKAVAAPTTAPDTADPIALIALAAAASGAALVIGKRK